MGNTQTASSADQKPPTTVKNRKNSNVKERVLAKFGHRKTLPKEVVNVKIDEENEGNATCEDEPSCQKIIEPTTSTATDTAKIESIVESAVEINKRFSQYSQGADSAKDALDCG